MKDELQRVLMNSKVDYGDLRYEENRETKVMFEGEELKEANTSNLEGGHLRIYMDGSKATGSFSDPEDAQDTIKDLINYNQLAGKFKKEKIRLKGAPVQREQVLLKPEDDPRLRSLKEKKELTQEYNKLILKKKNIVNTRFLYQDFYSHRYFLNTEGTVIEYQLLICNIFGVIFAKEGDLVQTKRLSFGGSPEFSRLLNREEDVLENVGIAQDLLKADPIKAGSYPVVINPRLAAVFIHEAFGHLSEADITMNNPRFREKLKLGAELGNEILSVYDDPGIEGVPGHYRYDDEGVLGSRTPLIKDGILSGRLHSRETAENFQEALSGNMRAVDCQFTPIIRMSNIFIEPRKNSREDLFSSIDDGYYLLNGKGGQTTGDQFTFGAEYGYCIKGGEKGAMVRDINISGELFSTLKKISMVASDLTFGEMGGCGKGNPMQLNRFSGMGSPHVQISAVNVGGV